MAASIGDRTAFAVLASSAEQLLLEPSDESQVIADALGLLEDGFGMSGRIVIGTDARADGLLVPMIVRGNSIGVLAVDASKRPTLDEERALATFARVVAIAIEQARQRRATEAAHEETLRLSLTDELTGASNARHVMHRLREEIEFARRHEESTALLVVDGDFMKQVNDVHGHAEGNHLLIQMTSAMRATLRLTDVLGRFGGDEFVLVLPRTTPREAVAAAERLRAAVAAHEFRTSTGAPLHATVSVGIATYPRDGSTPDELFRAADRALYAAKQGGRDRVIEADVR